MRTLGKKQKHDEGRFGLTPEEAERLIEDGVVEELGGYGWEPANDFENEDNGQEEYTEDVVVGTKRKAEDQADDSERRGCPAVPSRDD